MQYISIPPTYWHSMVGLNRKSPNWPFLRPAFSPWTFLITWWDRQSTGWQCQWLLRPCISPQRPEIIHNQNFISNPKSAFCQQSNKICCLFRTPPPLGSPLIEKHSLTHLTFLTDILSHHWSVNLKLMVETIFRTYIDAHKEMTKS